MQGVGFRVRAGLGSITHSGSSSLLDVRYVYDYLLSSSLCSLLRNLLATMTLFHFAGRQAIARRSHGWTIVRARGCRNTDDVFVRPLLLMDIQICVSDEHLGQSARRVEKEVYSIEHDNVDIK